MLISWALYMKNWFIRILPQIQLPITRILWKPLLQKDDHINDSDAANGLLPFWEAEILNQALLL